MPGRIIPQHQEEAIQTFVRVNHKIRVPSVLCVSADGEQIGIVPTREALSLAQKAGLDLVEIAPNAQPPVCRIMDYGKFKYEQDKKDKLAKKHQTSSKVKEVQFHPNVGDHDYETKVRHIHEFMEEGHRVKVSLYFRGREGAHHDIGFEVMKKVLRDCADIGIAEQPPKLMGRAIYMLLSVRPGVKSRQKQEESPAPES